VFCIYIQPRKKERKKEMNKQDIIAKVQASTKETITHADAERAVNAVFNSIQDAVAAGEIVSLVGFGSFFTRDRAARTARNPQTGGIINVPAKKSPCFKAGKVFKDIVNK
jgi:DNA-binding protein HU-beta